MFVAESEEIVQEFVVAEVGQFFRLTEVPWAKPVGRAGGDTFSGGNGGKGSLWKKGLWDWVWAAGGAITSGGHLVCGFLRESGWFP